LQHKNTQSQSAAVADINKKVFQHLSESRQFSVCPMHIGWKSVCWVWEPKLLWEGQNVSGVSLSCSCYRQWNNKQLTSTTVSPIYFEQSHRPPLSLTLCRKPW